MKLADFILSNMENILQEWQDYASTLQPQEHMNQEALRDHAQEMLESIAKDLTTPQTSIEEKNKSKGQSNPLDPPSEKIDKRLKNTA